MCKRDFILFFSVVFTVYSLLNFYIFMRGWQVLDGTPFRAIYLFVFLFLSLAFIAGRILERKQLSWLSAVLVMVGVRNTRRSDLPATSNSLRQAGILV